MDFSRAQVVILRGASGLQRDRFAPRGCVWHGRCFTSVPYGSIGTEEAMRLARGASDVNRRNGFLAPGHSASPMRMWRVRGPRFFCWSNRGQFASASSHRRLHMLWLYRVERALGVLGSRFLLGAKWHGRRSAARRGSRIF